MFFHTQSTCKAQGVHYQRVPAENKLDSKIEKGYAELKKVEGLVDKKLEINKKLPRH